MPSFRRRIQVAFAGIGIDPITDLRVAFEADKLDGQQVNHALIWIYNLSPGARALLARPYPLDARLVEPVVTVFLSAGYEGDVKRVMAGDLVSATNRRDGADWVTELDVFSGFNVATKAEISVNFSTPTSARAITDALVAPLGLDVRYTDEARQTLERERVSDYAEIGLSYRLADEFLHRYDLAFTIDEDGQGLVYAPTRPRDPDAGQSASNTLSPQTGMVGAPVITNVGVELVTLLRPDLRLLQRIFVESQTTAGTLGGSALASDYHIRAMRHSGDTRGPEWFTEIEAVYSDLIEVPY